MTKINLENIKNKWIGLRGEKKRVQLGNLKANLIGNYVQGALWLSLTSSSGLQGRSLSGMSH